MNEVLADSVTYNALLGDSNACAYMKRSTTWSTDICTSQYAMNLLGQYDTACDALLSDSTWASAIANSTYWESVLITKVPTMTSDTTPSGECLIDGTPTGNAVPYKAFDGDSSTFCHPVNLTSDAGYIGYKFPYKVIVEKIAITPRYIGGQSGFVKGFVFAGSNDGVTYTDLYSGTHANDGNKEIYTVPNTTAYQYFIVRRNGASYTGDGSMQIVELQFYGRTTSSEKIHGGNPTYDSFYRIVDGNHVPVTDPSLLDAGTYTIYSNGLAKATDLTSDYGKTVRICPNTKEIVVRPDNALYWWGYKSSNIQESSSTNGWTLYGASFVAPTWNNYDIYMTDPSNATCGVGTNNKISAQILHCVYTLQSGPAGIFMFADSNKRILSSSGSENHYVTLDSTNLSHKAYDITSLYPSIQVFIGVCGLQGNGRGTMNALWYE